MLLELEATCNLVPADYCIETYLCLSGEQGIELGAKAMVESGAEMLYTTQPRPKSEIQIRRDKAGRMTNHEELEVWIHNLHGQGDNSLTCLGRSEQKLTWALGSFCLTCREAGLNVWSLKVTRPQL